MPSGPNGEKADWSDPKGLRFNSIKRVIIEFACVVEQRFGVGMHVREFFDLSITVGTGVTLFLSMQFLGYAVVRYLNREGTACSRDRKAPPSSR